MLKLIALILTGVLVAVAAPAMAVDVRGETYFEHIPTLLHAGTDNYSTTYNYARYSFDVAVPANGEAVGSLYIGFPDRIAVPSADMVSVSDSAGKAIALQNYAVQNNTAQLNFAQPVPPGSKINIQFYPMRNPRLGGTYLFEVSAAPAGPAPHLQFLSFGRINFYAPSGGHR
ncbi:DUF2808 domain-containing protein [Gloeobacter kilaueensis]|uniref:DUF2808 domain-containing protein n=1 Tax=Gloeobacter kilaueensis (strain ATCC BAA-2537 / CCAP 1431/1 / ULC 316 / JS1) TaxID=1183438 RepID=U5QHX4_GLOK1|nr:DUF2808 domain-containing protein [Gloeobacter kilaueensis]AGY58526.1 hypothetical protein GKIL_2280 [Gloeobacter kilaueensis JS1]